ncbi:MAG: Crp/Fnr family transcriptional regulator [Pseudomonadota bacterium]
MANAIISVFKEHVTARGYHLSDAAWKCICPQLKPVSASRGDVLLDSAQVTQHVYFVCHGIAASIQNTSDGGEQIARFFERGHLCSNLTSVWHQEVSSDTLVAMSAFAGVSIPFALFHDEFMSDAPLSLYWREMVFQTLVFDKDLICAKTIRDVETRYRFLVDRYDHVIDAVPDKYIARFLGITPQGLSRFKKNLSELT